MDNFEKSKMLDKYVAPSQRQRESSNLNTSIGPEYYRQFQPPAYTVSEDSPTNDMATYSTVSAVTVTPSESISRVVSSNIITDPTIIRRATSFSLLSPSDLESPIFPSPTNNRPATATRPSDSSSRYGSTPVARPKLERLVIPTKTDSLSSGFPYDPRVYELISHDEWHQFTQDIVNAAKLSFMDDYQAWVAGIATGTITFMLTVIFGPTAGWYTGRKVHRKNVLKNVKERLERDGEIRSKIRSWNEETFKDRGFEAWLELPLDTPQNKKTSESKQEKKIAKKAERRFKIVLQPVSTARELAWSTLLQQPLRHEILSEAMDNDLRDPVELQNSQAAMQELDAAQVKDGKTSSKTLSPSRDTNEWSQQFAAELP